MAARPRSAYFKCGRYADRPVTITRKGSGRRFDRLERLQLSVLMPFMAKHQRLVYELLGNTLGKD